MTHFHQRVSGKARPCEIEGEYLVIHDKLKLYALGAGVTYHLEYRVNASTNSFSIERLKKNQPQDQICLQVLKEIARHLKDSSFWLSRRCNACLRYCYTSSSFIFGPISSIVHPFYTFTESIFLSKPRDEGVMAYIITRKPTLNKIDLDFGNIGTHLLKKTNLIQMPLEKHLEFPWMDLDFSNPAALIKKMDTLIFFS